MASNEKKPKTGAVASSSGHVHIVEAPEEEGKHERETRQPRRNNSEDRMSGSFHHILFSSYSFSEFGRKQRKFGSGRQLAHNCL
jgi:hypothetical protein